MPSLKKKIALLADFGVPMWQRWGIEAAEGIKTLKGVAKDVISKKAWTDPRKNSIYTSDLGKGFSEARNRVKQSLRKTNDKNIMSELEKNKGLDLQVDRMRQSAKKKLNSGGLYDLAPLSRQEPDGLLAVNKSYNVGKKAKK